MSVGLHKDHSLFYNAGAGDLLKFRVKYFGLYIAKFSHLTVFLFRGRKQVDEVHTDGCLLLIANL